MTELKKPNSKATKGELTAFIDQLEDVVKQAMEEAEDLKTANEKLRKEKVVASVEGGLTESSELVEIAGVLIKKLETAAGNLEESKTEYKDVKEAVELKKAELKELFDIEKNAYTLSAIIAGQKKAKEEFEADKAEILEKHQADLEALKEEIKITREAELKRESEYDSELSKTRAREEHDYNYNFDRKSKEKQDELNDILAKMKKEHDAKIEAENANIAKLRAKLVEDQTAFEDKVEDYEKYRDAFVSKEEDIKVAVETATKDAEKRVTKSYETKIHFIERSHKKDVEMAENENATLRETIERLEKEKETLAAQVKESYDKLQNIALASVNGDKYKEAMGAMAHATATKTPQ